MKWIHRVTCLNKIKDSILFFLAFLMKKITTNRNVKINFGHPFRKCKNNLEMERV